MNASIFKSFVVAVLMIAQVHFAYSQTASILPNAKTTFVDANGKPLTSGTVDFYIPGGFVRKTTWQDAAETVPNLNPVKLDAAGRALILGSGDYRQIVKDKNGNVIWDQVTSSTGTSSGGGTASTGDGDLVGTIKPWAGSIAPNQYVFAYGQELARASFTAFYSAIVSTQAVFCNSGSPILNGLSDTNSFWIGMSLEVSCLGAGTSTVLSKTASTVTMAVNANVTTNTNASFFPWGRGNGTTTFNVPDLRGVVLAGNNIMGGVSGSQLTTTYFGATDPNSAGALGGNQNRILLTSNLPAYTPAGTNVVAFGASNTNIQSTTNGGSAAVGTSTTVGNTANLAGTLGLSATATFTGTAAANGGVAATVAVSAAGGGYVNGAQPATLVGGTCSTQPTITVTVAANVFSSAVVLNPGLCSIIPSNPVFTSLGGGGSINVTWSAAPISVVQPTRTANFIVKVTPDTNSSTASGVTSLGSMIGDIACGIGLTCTGNIVSVGNLPAPTAFQLGGVFTKTCSASNWFSTLDGTGTFGCSQPSFADLTGTITLAQISANLITYAKLQQGTALSVVGNPTNALANVQDIIAASDGQVMRRSGTAIGFGALDLASANSITNKTPVANGGTNLATGISGGVLCFTGTGVIASSVLQTANAIMLGGGAGVCPTPLGSLGTVTTVLHGNAAGAPTFGGVVFADITSSEIATAAQYFAGTASKLVQSGIIYPTETTTTFGTTTTFDFSTFINTAVTLTGNITTMTLSGVIAGKAGTIRFIQDGTGSRTAAFNTIFKFTGGTIPTLSTAINAQDFLNYNCITAIICQASLNKDVRNP